MVVENRAGAGGNIGADVVAKAPPDGYTLLMTSGSIFTANPHMYKQMPFDPVKDFVAGHQRGERPAAGRGASDRCRPRASRSSIALAKAKPGTINFGSAGIGSQIHMAAENFVNAAGIEVDARPLQGRERRRYTDLVGRLRSSSWSATSPPHRPFVSNGRLRALGVTSKTRSPLLPDVPTVAETACPASRTAAGSASCCRPARRRTIVDKIYHDTRKALEDTDLKARLYVQGMAPVGNTPARVRRRR